MSGRKKQVSGGASKAYLVSFGDTMTALLAFFIVLNSLAEEQTGANMHAGTGSFVNAFSSSGQPGHVFGSRSSDVIQQRAQKPIYALAKNMDSSGENIGPDEVDEERSVLDREKEQFQKFLTELENQLDLSSLPAIEDQVAFDTFEAPETKSGKLSLQAVQLLSEAVAKLRQPDVTLEIVLWANMPSASSLKRKLQQSVDLRKEVEQTFWMREDQKTRIRYRVKPWLFADAKRPYMSVILGKEKPSA